MIIFAKRIMAQKFEKCDCKAIHVSKHNHMSTALKMPVSAVQFCLEPPLQIALGKSIY